MYQSSMQKNQPEQYRYYSRGVLSTLSMICTVGILLFLLVPILLATVARSDLFAHNSWLHTLSPAGGLLLFSEIVFVMLLDWRGVISLRGAVKTYRVYQGRMVKRHPWLLLLYALFPYVMLPIYLIRAELDSWRIKQLRMQRLAWQRKQQIANLEAEMGILPAIESECRVCKRPLVVGAEFCQYCGEPVMLRPKICPQCLSSALPDALWCPKCRAVLPDEA